jgi:hypothetical protein
MYHSALLLLVLCALVAADRTNSRFRKVLLIRSIRQHLCCLVAILFISCLITAKFSTFIQFATADCSGPVQSWTQYPGLCEPYPGGATSHKSICQLSGSAWTPGSMSYSTPDCSGLGSWSPNPNPDTCQQKGASQSGSQKIQCQVKRCTARVVGARTVSVGFYSAVSVRCLFVCLIHLQGLLLPPPPPFSPHRTLPHPIHGLKTYTSPQGVPQVKYSTACTMASAARIA